MKIKKKKYISNYKNFNKKYRKIYWLPLNIDLSKRPADLRYLVTKLIVF